MICFAMSLRADTVLNGSVFVKRLIPIIIILNSSPSDMALITFLPATAILSEAS